MYELFDMIDKCKKCEFNSEYLPKIYGKGNITPTIMIISNEPKMENEQEQSSLINPKLYAEFKLNSLLSKIGINKKDVYYTHCIKCRPQDIDGNQLKVKKLWLRNCKNILLKEIEFVSPDFIICLGKDAFYTITKKDIKLTENHGKIFKLKINDKSIRMMITYNIDAILYKESLEKDIINDFKRFKLKIGE